jgi:hypothetical protein
MQPGFLCEGDRLVERIQQIDEVATQDDHIVDRKSASAGAVPVNYLNLRRNQRPLGWANRRYRF